jgi:hypothetical protein
LRFVDFLKTTVLVCAGAASVLAAVTVVAASADDNAPLVGFAVGWWIVAAALGAWLGRRAETTPPIARLLAGARATTTLPEQRPGSVLVNRLWPLLVVMVVSGAVAFVFPQVPAIAAGFAIIWALIWRRQDAAVTAIEERDGIGFYIERTSPLRPMQLVRTPGFSRTVPSTNGAG